MLASYTDYDPSGGAALAAALAIVGFVFFFIFVIYYVVTAFFYMKLFEKAGVQGKWRAWVPVYREMIFAKLGDLSPWWILVLIGASIVINLIPYLGAIIGWLVSVAAIVYLALAAYRIQQKLSKEAPWLILYVLLQPVWLGIVGLDKSRWNPNVPPAPWASNFLADKTVWPGIPVQPSAAPAAPAQGYAPQGYQAPPQGYQAPPQGYQAPPAAPPQGYQAPPTQPPAPPASTTPPAAPPVAPTDPEQPRP